MTGSRRYRQRRYKHLPPRREEPVPVPEPMTVREAVALALHGYYCIGDGNETGEPCLGKDADVEGWTPVAENLVKVLRSAGLAIHRVADCVRAPAVEGREMTRAEEIRFGLRVPEQRREEAAAIRPEEYVFGDEP